MIKINEGSIGHWVIRLLWVAAVVAFVIYIPTKTETGTVGDMTLAIELAIAAMSLNLVLGYTGIISIGHSAFFGLGMYTTAILVVALRVDRRAGRSSSPRRSPSSSAPSSSLPALRLKGIYLALVTLALAVLFPVLVKWDKLAWLTEGAAGISGVSYEDIPDWPLLARAPWARGPGDLRLLARHRPARHLLPRVPRHREEPRRPVADRHPRQRDGVGGDGRAPGADEDARVRHLGGDVLARRLARGDPGATSPAPTSATSRSSGASRSS